MNFITLPKETQENGSLVQWNPFPQFTLPTKRVGLAISGHGACYAAVLGPAAAEELGKQPCFGYGAHGETERSSISRLGQATTTKWPWRIAMMPLKVVF